MKEVALIHTVKLVLETFGEKVKTAIKDIKITNTLDEYLAADPAERGEFTIKNMNRLFKIIKCAEMTDADAIVVTCSTLSPTVELVKPFINVPLIAIDEAMLKKAVEIGSNIAVIATAESTIIPTTQGLYREAAKSNKKIQLSIIRCPDAYAAMKSGDIAWHNEIIMKKACCIKDQDVVVLAQASMAEIEEDIAKICQIPVLSSPKLCIEQLKSILTDSKTNNK
ncbi:aspartate/glutamate racemase family protein [Tepidanaerobacter sp. EBM-49]|uniref:aspartate/glutamate racemase family protein n=1 Tax=Tepidanaerobacter sp. EBM-49 TaxID=1918504 RepID=UPI00257C1804|nr:aspartate/glutamate racemase family protein [Tepidanaerobacter sp. EBM-49]